MTRDHRTVVTCDRCGESTDNPRGDWRHLESESYQYRVAHQADLCPACMEAFRQWFAEGKLATAEDASPIALNRGGVAGSGPSDSPPSNAPSASV